MKNDTFSFGSFGCKRVEWCGEGVREQPLNRFRRSPSFDLPLRSDNSGSTQSFIHFLSHLRLWGYVVFDSVYLHTISFSLCVFFHSCFSFTLDFLITTFFSLDFVYFRIYQFNRCYSCYDDALVVRVVVIRSVGRTHVCTPFSRPIQLLCGICGYRCNRRRCHQSGAVRWFNVLEVNMMVNEFSSLHTHRFSLS